MTDLNLKSKLPNVGTTIFTEMSSLALKHNAINLGQGFPDYEMNADLADLVTKAMNEGYNQYVHMNGYLPLRESLSEKISSLYTTAVNPDSQITITPGATYAIYTALTTILQPGDEVIIFEPAYDCYIPTVELNAAVPVLIELEFPKYKIDWGLVKQKITTKTRMIMLNSPHNPTGSVLSKEDIQQLQSIVQNTNIIILSDEVYEHIIFENIEHQSILRYPDLLERSFVCFSFGKVYNCTGWKLGYCISSPELMKEFRKIHQFNCFTCHSPSQVALASFIKNKEVYLSLAGFLQDKKDRFQNMMSATKFIALPSYGSYFQCYSYSKISLETEKDFAIRLTTDYGVASIPMSAFYKEEKENMVLRFCFSKKIETLEAAVERLFKI